MSNPSNPTMARIVESAKQEFLSCGYEKSCLRSITKAAGVTTGALYGYFRSKEDIFELLVGQQYRTLLQTFRDAIDSFALLTPLQQLQQHMQYGLDTLYRMADYIYDNWDAFRLIMCSSKGTAYSNLVDDLSQLDFEAGFRMFQALEPLGIRSGVKPQLHRILSRGISSSFMELVVQSVPKQEARIYLQQMMDYHYAGWHNLILHLDGTQFPEHLRKYTP